jgi:1-phosphatidylinositol-3-phosphate 5-kinase
MSSSHSSEGVALNRDYALPAALKKVNLSAATSQSRTNSSVMPVTMYSDGFEAAFDGAGSAGASRKTSTSNLHSVAGGNHDPSERPFIGTALRGSSSQAYATTAATSAHVAEGGGRSLQDKDNLFAEAEDDFDDSASDDSISESSDDDVVLLHSKLPAGTSRRPLKTESNRKSSVAQSGPSLKPRSSLTLPLTANKPEFHLTPPAVPLAPNSSASMPPPDESRPSGISQSSTKPDSNLPQLSALNLQSKAPTRSDLSLPVATEAQKGDAQNKKTAGQTSRLPGFKITGVPSSDADSSPAGTSTTATDQRATASVYWQPSNDYGTGKMVNGTHASGITGSTEAVSHALRQLRREKITKDFWMKDEVCKDCFLCGSTFSAWRRKHHCRKYFYELARSFWWTNLRCAGLCGQIFCSKCTTLISGDEFGHPGSMRVCTPCLGIVNDCQDDSDSDDFSSAAVFRRPHVDNSTVPPSLQGESSSAGFRMPKNLRPGQTPLMAIPATRTTAGNNPNRRSQILEIDADLPSPPRPTSARSVKAFSRPVTAGSSKGLFGSSLLQSHHSQTPGQHMHHHPSHHPNHHHHHHHHKRARSHPRLLIGTPAAEEGAPFHRNIIDDKRNGKLLPAFHADSILDPDLAPYMSDEDWSDEEQLSIFATIAPKATEHSTGTNSVDTAAPSTPSASIKGAGFLGSASARARRAKSKSRGSISGLTALLGGSERSGSGGDKDSTQPRRTGRRRGTSFIGPLTQRPVTRGKSRGLIRSLADGTGAASSSASGSPITASPRASRNASMRGPLAPTVELNTASLEHVKKLLKQLLTDADIPNVEQWEKALIPILLKSTDDLNPDLRAGDDIDIRHYVKVKRIPGGKPRDTSCISGVAFTKNLALKSMPRNISHPRIVVVTFPIEYSRHQQQLMSLEPVIAQEREFLQNMINRIVALRPTLLLVEKNVSGLALQLLDQANVATAYHVKPSVIEAVARCAQADILSSVDKLVLSNFRLGRCASFEVKTFVHNEIPGRKKTFMNLSGCQKDLGCTIVLRGGDMATLAVIKQITELMVYVVYNLKLETCLMRDEFVLIPSSPVPPTVGSILNPRSPGSLTISTQAISLGGDDNVEVVGEALEGAKSEAEGEKETSETKEGTKGEERNDEEKREEHAQLSPVPLSSDQLPDDIPNPTYYEDMVRKHETKILSASPFVKYMQPYLLTRARELERRLIYLRRLRDSLVIPEDDDEPEKERTDPEKVAVLDPEKAVPVEKPKPQENFVLVDPDAVHGKGDVKHATNKKATEVLRAIYDAEYDKALHVYETQKKQWENYLSQYDDLFDPFAHQSIAILYSMVCTVTTVPCEGPEIRRLEFYYQDLEWPLGKSDCTLGQYVEFLCDTADHICDSTSCDRRMIEHHRSYVHGQARVSVLVSDQMSCPIQGMQNTILMWSYCKKCANTNNPAIPMSESTWKYSFGKYLELSFWSSEMKIRAGSCPHDLNRDHVRCFGYHGLTVLFQHDPIDLLEIVVPRTRITYKPEIDLRVKNDQYTQTEIKIRSFFASVRARLKGINIESVSPEKTENCNREIEILITRAHDDENWLISKLQEKYNKSKYYEIIPLNRALRALQEKVVEWDSKFADFDNNYFPSEKDIRRLATLQLKKIFLDNSSTTSLRSDSEPTPTHEKEGDGGKPLSIDGANTPDTSALSSPVALSSEQAHDVLAAVVEEEQEKGKEKAAEAAEANALAPEGVAQQSQTPDDFDTRKQEGPPMEQLVPDPTPLTESVSQPATPEAFSESLHSKSEPALAEMSPVPTEESSTAPADVAPKPSGLPRPSQVPVSRPPLMSGIPRPDTTRRKPPPAFLRTVSVPEVVRRKDLAKPGSITLGRKSPTMPLKKSSVAKTTEKPQSEKKDRFRLGSLQSKPKEKHPPSHIPRSMPSLTVNLKRPNRDSSKVSSLAKHFELLSREFEKERAREKRQRAARPRALPVATSRPIVEVYKNVRDAVEEASDEEQSDSQHPRPPSRETTNMTTSSETFKTISPVVSRPESITPPEHAGVQPVDTPNNVPEHPPQLTPSHSEADVSDEERSIASDDHETPSLPSIDDVLPPSSTDTEEVLRLPQQHRSAWMKMLSNFWAERSASGWSSLDYPLHPTDHVFNDSDIIVREDEPSSLIAFTLNCSDYIEKLRDIRNSDYSHIGAGRPTSSGAQVHKHSFNLAEHPELERSLLKTTGTHLRYQFQEGTAKMFCKIFYAEQFDALRRNCGIADRYVESLSRCIKWDSKGGKTRSVFLKTQDERIVLKSLSPIETAAFIKFAPAYFQFMSEAFFHEVCFAVHSTVLN